jgi:aryl-alcohol dehydrogenase-like predicted oxidoreductase
MEGWGCDRSTGIAITREFIEAGGNFIDTADMYSLGVSEDVLGEALKEYSRDDLVIATKCWFRMNPSPNAKGLSRKHIFEAVEGSLRRLKSDYVDLFQVHGPDPFTPQEETMRALDDLIRDGKVRYVGCSNYFGWQISRANALAERMGLTRFISGQHLYNLLRRDIEREVLPACAAEGLGMLCWSPLASGLLTGKYRGQEQPSSDSRVGLRAEIDLPRYWNEGSFRIIDEVVKIAESTSKTPAQVSLAWLLHDRRITSVIVGARKISQLRDSLMAGDWDLPDDLHRQLSEVVPFQLGYPQDWIDSTWENIAGTEEFFRWKTQ